ncbi:MAG: hypothetical protein CVT88_10165, partial [Candidatus Altiarchaeales archaeon HGW-Altiarchaeales-1]
EPVFVEQYLKHIDTLNWLGAEDDGTLMGRTYLTASESSPTGGVIYNPNDYSINVSVYNSNRGYTTTGNFNDSIITWTAAATCNIPANSYGRCSYNGNKVIVKLNSTDRFQFIGGDLTAQNLYSLNHFYTRIPPVNKMDTNFSTRFAIAQGRVGHYSGGGNRGGAAYIWQLQGCEDNLINFDPGATITYAETAGTIPATFQGRNTTLNFTNYGSITQTSITACNGSFSLYNVMFLSPLNGADYNCGSMLSTCNPLVAYCSVSCTCAENGIGLFGPITLMAGEPWALDLKNGRIAMTWDWGMSSLYSMNIRYGDNGTSGIIRLGGTEGLYGSGDDSNIKFNSTSPVKFYRIGLAECSNSPIESESPYIVI